MAEVMSTPSAVSGRINFLEKDELYDTEKPYSLMINPGDENFPRSNFKLHEPADWMIEDIRGRQHEFSIERNGFNLIGLESQMTYDDYDNEEKRLTVYLDEAAEALKSSLGATRVQIFEHLLRKRHETSPISTGETYKYNQPTSIAQIDATPEWMAGMVRKLNSKEADELQKHRIRGVNLWKPLRGPVCDWPLALCDPSTVDPTLVEPSDVVYGDYVVENCQTYHAPEQKWYYIRDQSPSEAWVFVQSDSFNPDRPGVPHSSFPHPMSSATDMPRESIEVRALVYYEDDATRAT